MRSKIKQIFKSEILKNVLTLFTGTVIAQAIPFILAPVISRIYTSADFAFFADYISIFNLVAVISTGRYSFAIVSAEKQKDAVNLLALSVIIAGIVSIISLLLLIPLHSYIAVWLDNPKLSNWLFFIPAGIVFFGLFEALTYWLNRNKRYKSLSSAKIARTSGIGGINIAVGLLKFKKSGLIIGQIFGDFLAGLTASIIFWKKDKNKLKEISKNDIKRVAEKYKEFPLFNSIQAFSDKFRESGVILIISSFFTDSVTGNYFWGIKYAKAPITILTFALFQVFYQKFSEINNKGENLVPLLVNILKKNILISFSLFIVFFFFAEPLFAFVFGEEWRQAGYFVKILSPFLAINFLTGPISFIPFVLKKQKEFLKIALFYNFAVPLGVYIYSYNFHNIEYTVIAQTIIGSISLLIILFWLISSTKKYDRQAK